MKHVYIRGNELFPERVIAELEKRGGKNVYDKRGNRPNCFYYIGDSNDINNLECESLLGKTIATHPDWKEIFVELKCEFKQPIDFFTRSFEQQLAITFQKGAEWADQNPAWHKYPEEKPLTPKIYEDVYIVSRYNKYGSHVTTLLWNGESFGRWYNDDYASTWHSYDDVYAWIEIPKPAKFD